MPVPHPILKVKHVALRCFSKYSVSSKSCCISQLLQPRSYFISLLNQWRRKGERSLSASCLSVDESSKAKAFTHPIQLWRHQVKLRYKFSHTSSDSSFEKHSRAYFPSHFALLNYPARRETSTRNDYYFIGEFIFHAVHLQADSSLFLLLLLLLKKTLNDFFLGIDYMILFGKRIQGFLMFEKDLMFAARGDGWNKKFNSLFYRLCLMLFVLQTKKGCSNR